MAHISQSFNAPVTLAFFLFCPLEGKNSAQIQLRQERGKALSQCIVTEPQGRLVTPSGKLRRRAKDGRVCREGAGSVACVNLGYLKDS